MLDQLTQVVLDGGEGGDRCLARRSIEARKDAHDEYAERYQREIGQLVWSHPAITHSHYKNPQGKVFTLSPWPLEQYWDWTRAVNPDDYIIE